jgi:uncharacterized membrane-anchored protein
MSDTVLTARGLSSLAANIRTRHEDEICGILCDGDCEICAPTANKYHFDDEASRRWDAKKLTVPRDPAEEGDDYTPEEWVEIHCELWKMRTAASQNDKTPLQRFQNAARQLKHSRSFIAKVWNLEGHTPEFAECCEDEPVGTGSGYGTITVHETSSNTGEEDYDQDIPLDETLFDDDDDDDIVVAMSSEDEGPAFPAGFDPNPNKIH